MAGGGVGGGGGGAFLDALDKSQSKRDGGFKNNWSFDHSEESEGDAEKDEASLLSIDESDGTSSEKKSLHYRPGTIGPRCDFLRTYTRRSKVDTSRVLKGNSIGLNMLANKKLSENVHNISRTGTLLHGRRFHHTHVQTSVVKTAAQSNLDRKESSVSLPALTSGLQPMLLRTMEATQEYSEQLHSETNSILGETVTGLTGFRVKLTVTAAETF